MTPFCRAETTWREGGCVWRKGMEGKGKERNGRKWKGRDLKDENTSKEKKIVIERDREIER